MGKGVETGNNLLIDQINNPNRVIPFKMAPLVLIGTFLTHLFGGSAGREGTAVQISSSLADQLNYLRKFSPENRKIILTCGISAGFASVFGTPMAAMIFALEVCWIGRFRYEALYPSAIAAIIGSLVCDAWGVHHTQYHIKLVPSITVQNILLCGGAGICFGLAARFYVSLTSIITRYFKQTISYAPFRPMLAGVLIALTTFGIGSTKYIGLGIPTIISAFETQLPPVDFLIKIIFTAVTIGAGFKGGEVTPLFFIGATLGNTLSMIVPLPMALLAGLGFVAVFSGASNTPIASSIMAIEIFGIECGVYAIVACTVAYLFSGRTGIYSAQILGS